MDIQSTAREFLSRKRIAVAGVSTRRDTPANLIFKTLRARGVEAIPISSSTKEFEGSPCYPDVKSIPEAPEALVIVTRPAVAEALVRECVDARVPRVWMHCALGTRPRFLKGVAASTTSVSEAAVRLCRDHGITVIAGSCPMQFIGDPGHRCMRALLSVVGALEATA